MPSQIKIESVTLSGFRAYLNKQTFSLLQGEIHKSLDDELPKAAALAARGLAQDYVILTNHPVSGATEIKIKNEFQLAGVAECRIFGRDWIVRQIQRSARLRMIVPRLYGLGDLSNILDGRAYEQASMILSAMGEDLKRLVVTDAHRKSVKALTEHNFVLLLGAPAAAKSTIGARAYCEIRA